MHVATTTRYGFRGQDWGGVAPRAAVSVINNHRFGGHAESIPIWVDRDADECSVSSEFCWGEQEDFIGEEILEWVCCHVWHQLCRPWKIATPPELVLVGGGSQSQNRHSPVGHEDDVRATPQLRVEMQGEDIPTPTVSASTATVRRFRSIF